MSQNTGFFTFNYGKVLTYGYKYDIITEKITYKKGDLHMKKLFISLLATALSATLFTGCAQQQEPVEIAGPFDHIDPIKISARIDALGEISDISKLSEIYSLIHDCKGLTEAKFAQVSNYSKIDESLESTVDLFNEEDVKLKVMSFNVRNGEYGDGRMELLLSTIMDESPDLVGLQEVGDSWKPFFRENIDSTGYAKLGQGRYQLGHSEESSILYKKDKFDLIESDTVWLTDTPEIESKWRDPADPNDGFPRIMTYAVLKRKSDGTVFVFANTHLETDPPAQDHQAYWLTQILLEKFSNEYPIILTGDFNCSEGSGAYNTIVDFGFEPTNRYGENTCTFNGYSRKGTEGPVIDFCFVNEYIPVRSYKVMPATTNDQFVSDHNAVVSEIMLLPEITTEIIED